MHLVDDNGIMEMPLFNALPHLKAHCGACLDTGMFRRTSGEVVLCPRKCVTKYSDAAKQLYRAVFARQSKRLWIEAQAFDLARILTHYTAENPCKRERLQSTFFAEHPDAQIGDGERKIKGLIEVLRHDWLLPVGSSKRPPHGHWIMTSAAELHEWRKAATAAPITQLATIYRVYRHNAPHFHGQTELDYLAESGDELDLMLELATEIETRIQEMESAA